MINVTISFQTTEQALSMADQMVHTANDLQRAVNMLRHRPVSSVGYVSMDYIHSQNERIQQLRKNADAILRAAGEIQ